MQERGRLRENDRMRQEELRGEIKKKGKLRDSPKRRLEDKPQRHRDVKSETDTHVYMHRCTERNVCACTYTSLEERERELGRVQKRNV